MKIKKKDHRFIAALPSLRKKLEKTDELRKQRLREARKQNNVRALLNELADQELRPKILSAQQRMAIMYMADFVNNYSDKWISKKVNVDLRDLYKWKNDPLFIRALDKEITRRITYGRKIAFQNVFRALGRGDMKATFKYLEMTGDLKNTLEVKDRTGENTELSDEELAAQIAELSEQVTKGPVPSEN